MSRISKESIESQLPPVEWFQWFGGILLICLALPFTFREGLSHMVSKWAAPEYSHGYLIPIIALLLAWQKLAELRQVKTSSSWIGAVVVFVGALLFFIGELGTIYTLIEYALLITFAGFVWAVIGWRGMRLLWAPLVYLFFAVPLPQFFYSRLSLEMQLIASELGVAIIRWFNISVFLDGNVIDLGVYQLQVVEACDGLRYLFPLMSFGFLVAYLIKTAIWQRIFVFMSTIPITILMNSFRIGITGVLIEYFGTEAAEGFLHDFQGWVIFMACVAILFGEIWLLNILSRSRQPLRDLVTLNFPTIDFRPRGGYYRSPPRSAVFAIVILLFASIASVVVTARDEATPDRKSFVSFPMQVGEWRGQRIPLERSIIDAIRVDDWVMGNYASVDRSSFVNFYVAYYASQRKGASAHSPQACIPGGGWKIERFAKTRVAGVLPAGGDLMVNRAIIKKGKARQIVYYWFQQRDRLLTNEYLVKWYLMWDAVTRNRTDGALIRIMTPLLNGEDMGEADRRLVDFLRTIFSELPPYFSDT